MSLGEATQVASILGVLITATALIFTIRSFQRQLQLNFFADYTKRYQELILRFPETVHRQDFSFDNLSEEDKGTLLRYMRAYFDLCSEEYFLRRNGHIGKKAWKEWKDGMYFAFSKVAFRDAWDILQVDTVFYRDFVDLVNDDLLHGPDMQKQKNKKTRTPIN